MFSAPGPIFCGTDGVGSRFHVLHSRMHFRRYRSRRVSFSYFALHDSFSAVPRVSGPVLLFCAPGPIFDGTNNVGYRFHVLRSQTHFGQYRGCRVPFYCFALPDPFSTVPTTLGTVFMFCAPGVFMFCAPGLIFGAFEGVESRFYVLRSQTRFR
jgi:hypothetical protein